MGAKHKKHSSGDLEHLRDDVSMLADQLKTVLSGKGEQVTNDVNKRIQKIRDDIEDAITGGWASTGRELMQDFRMGDVGETIQSTVRERPFTMLAIAAGLGMVMASQLRR